MSLPAHYGDPFGEQRRLEAGETGGIGHWAHEAVRIAAGTPGPHDVPAAGQQLVFLHLDGSDNVLPAAGDLVYSANSATAPASSAATNSAPLGSAIGRITSAANHHELGPIAFAVLYHQADGPQLLVETAENGVTYRIAASR